MFDLTGKKVVERVQWLKTIIDSQAVFSDDNKYRYLLTRTWDTKKLKATVLMLNPSTADDIRIDRTVMNLSNYLVDHCYGSLSVVNLYAYCATDPKQLKLSNQAQEKVNDQFILSACSSADTVIIGWTRNGHISRKKEVAALIRNLSCAFKCFKDQEGRFPRHPSRFASTWELMDYDFGYIGREN